MVIKKIVFSGLLLSGIFLAACQPQPEVEPTTDSMMLDETTPAMEDESIMMEGTDQPIPMEEELMNDTDASPTASPMMEEEM